MSVEIDLTNPVTKKVEVVKVPLMEHVKRSTKHRGSALIVAIACYASYLFIWVSCLIIFINNVALNVFILPTILMLVLSLGGAWWLGFGWKGKWGMSFINRTQAKSVTSGIIKHDQFV